MLSHMGYDPTNKDISTMALNSGGFLAGKHLVAYQDWNIWNPILRFSSSGPDHQSQVSSNPSEPIGDNGNAKTFLAVDAPRLQTTRSFCTVCKNLQEKYAGKNANNMYEYLGIAEVAYVHLKPAHPKKLTNQSLNASSMFQGFPAFRIVSIPRGN